MRKIQLAVNFSTPTSEFLRRGEIKIDLYKLPDWPHLVSQLHGSFPLYIHFDLHAGKNALDKVDWDQISSLAELTGTPYINLHLNTPDDLDTQSLTRVNQAVDDMIKDVSLAVKKFGPEKIIVENFPMALRGAEHLRPAVEPGNIRRVFIETGCNLLLDLPHARITSQTLGMDEREYISQLPVERLKEIHITGVGEHEGRLYDHMPMTDEDWDLFDWSLEQIRLQHWAIPDKISFEYGGLGEPFSWRTDPKVIAKQVPMLWSRIQKLNQKIS
jgi:uncharacterized protein (UPF0276 family)